MIRGRTQNGLLAALAAMLLSACGTVKYTVDDGREVNPVLLENIRLLGQGERLIRPAIARTASLNDSDCDTQWELPISVASSYDWPENDRVAWVRALQVDERLTVIGVVPDSGFSVGDKLTDLDGYQRNDSSKMLIELANLRDNGKPFWVTKSSGQKVQIKPYKVCRGYTRLAPPDNASFQDFHWLISYHPLEIFRPNVSPDEALWMVLWTQGLSETGGARMKTFHYSKKLLMTAIDLATLATGINGAAQAAKVAATQVSKSASEAATKAASEEVARKVLESAAKNAADAAAKEYAQRVGQEVLKSTGKQMATAVTGSMMSRAGNQLSAVSWVASYVFDQADSWAFERMRKLGEQPVAGATLHRKLMDQSLIHNAFVLDEERIGSLTLIARKMMYDEMLTAAIRGAPLDNFSLQLQDFNSVTTEMPGLDEGRSSPENTSSSTRETPDVSQSMPLASE